MLALDYHAVDVLMLVGNVAPIALYFLVLGLVNSHARPCLITSRSDFLALTTVLLPLLIWPVPEFVRAHLFGSLALGLLLAVLAFYYLLPHAAAGFVVYNVSRSQCLNALAAALRRLNLSGRWDNAVWTSDRGDLLIEIRQFSLLRNVSIHTTPSSDAARDCVHHIGLELRRSLQSVAQLPSNMGAALVMLGVTLMILPMSMVARHIDDLVEAMAHLFG